MLAELVPIQLVDATEIRTQLTWATGIPFVLCIALVPGFTEEIMFRGYVQRNLLRRWRPWKAIALSTVLFSVVHLDPVHIVFAAPIGIWVGIVAWRTGSVWPTIACHASVNGLWNIYGTFLVKLDPPYHVVLVSLCFAAVGAVLGFAAGVKLLVQLPRSGTPPVTVLD